MFLRKLLKEDPGTEIDDIIGNLHHVLKTKRGCGYFLDSFGLSETGYRTAEEVITSVSREVRENIELYEPRLQLVDIEDDYDEDTQRIRLTIRCRLRSRGEIVTIVLDPAGNSLDITTRAKLG